MKRKSVGIAVGTHSRYQLIALEEKQDKATGFTRKYYDFMKRLTGKRSIKSYEVAPKNTETKIDNNKQETKQQNINFTNNSKLSKMIKG